MKIDIKVLGQVEVGKDIKLNVSWDNSQLQEPISGECFWVRVLAVHEKDFVAVVNNETLFGEIHTMYLWNTVIVPLL